MRAPWLHLIKAVLDTGDWLGQRLIFQRRSPSVERILMDQPYGEHSLQRLDAYRPAAGYPLPAVVYIHGGGWVSGDKHTYTRVSKVIAEAGFVVFNINYRLGPVFRYPVPLQDAARAVDWVYRHAVRYGADPQRIFLAGESAGAHLALWTAAAAGNEALRQAAGVELACPAPALRGLGLFFGLFDLDGERSPLVRPFIDGFLGADAAHCASPVNYLSPKLPPVCVVCGERDILYAQSVRLVRELETCGARHAALFFPAAVYRDAEHAFLKYPSRRSTRETLEAWIRFMRQEIGESK